MADRRFFNPPPPPTNGIDRVAHRVPDRVAVRPMRYVAETHRESAANDWGLPASSPPAVVRGFARAVGDRLDGGVLRWDDRRDLISRARRLGIDRFEANLIIASVQHNAPPAPADTDAAAGWTHSVAIFAIVQSLIVIAAWWLIH